MIYVFRPNKKPYNYRLRLIRGVALEEIGNDSSMCECGGSNWYVRLEKGDPSMLAEIL